jgi:hypothetical protein
MIDVLKTLAKQPFWVITLVIGAVLVALPCVTVDKSFRWESHPPNTYWLLGVGLALVLLSALAYGFTLVQGAAGAAGEAGGADLSAVKQSKGMLWTSVGSCEIRVTYGRIETHELAPGSAVVLPCNEYFDDRSVRDLRTALGSYVVRVFDGQAADLVALVAQECRKRLGEGVEQQKTEDERELSFGAGRCLLLGKPLGRSVPMALVSTTTQRVGQGMVARFSYLFDGMRELVARLADERISEITMPLLGGGGLNEPLALMGLLLAITETVRYGQGGQRMKRVTIVLFKPDGNRAAAVDPAVARRALGLIGRAG